MLGSRFSKPLMHCCARERKLAILLLMLAPVAPAVLAQVTAAAPPTYILEGSIDGRDNHGYRLLPFQVSAGTERLTWAAVRTPPMPYRLLKLPDVYA